MAYPQDREVPEWVEIVSIQEVPHGDLVYDLTVFPDHNYYANGALVHNCSPPAVQAALLRVILDKAVGDTKLPEDINIIAAANPPEIAAGGWDLAPPLANRFCHLFWKLDSKKWSEGMISGWPAPTISKLPRRWEEAIPVARGFVASFIQRRPELLLVVPKEESNAGKAWASPRSWDNAATLWAACESIRAGAETRAELLAGCVGEGPALEYVQWVTELDLPDPKDVLRNPDKFKLPKRDDRLFAVLGAVVAEAVRELNKTTWNSAWRVLGKAAEAKRVDVAAMSAQILAKNRGAGMKAPKEIQHFIPVLKAAKLM
jgi:hypothetical protein